MLLGVAPTILRPTNVLAVLKPVFDPANKATNMVINSDGSVTRGGGGAWGAALALPAKSTGKWYFEQRVLAKGPSGGHGIATAIPNISVNAGAPPGRAGSNGTTYRVTSIEYNSTGLTGLAATVVGDTVGVAVDFNALTISYYLNNAPLGTVPLPSLASENGGLKPAFTGFDSQDKAIFTTEYLPPSGFFYWG